MDLHVFPILNPPPTSLLIHPSVSSQCTSPEHLSHASNLDWQSVSQLIIYMFQCYSLRSSHPHLLPQRTPFLRAFKSLVLEASWLYNFLSFPGDFHAEFLLYPPFLVPFLSLRLRIHPWASLPALQADWMVPLFYFCEKVSLVWLPSGQTAINLSLVGQKSMGS